MRMLKFRAWNGGNKEFMNGKDIKIFLDGSIAVFENAPLPLDKFKEYYPLIEIIEFSGVVDNNGTEIYEGDIVVVTNWLEGKPWVGHIHNCVVEFLHGKFELKNHWMHESLSRSDVKVIGNIFQNPDLLEN